MFFNKKLKVNGRYYGFVILVLALLALQGCAGFLMVGAATATVASQNQRTVGQTIEDHAIEFKIRRAVSENTELSSVSRIVPTSYNGIVLLVGQTPHDALRKTAVQIAQRTAKVRSVHEHIVLSEPIKLKQKSGDKWLKARIKAALLKNQGIKGLSIKVVVENETVYLMGMVTPHQAQKVIDAVHGMSGIQHIIQVFEYIE